MLQSRISGRAASIIIIVTISLSATALFFYQTANQAQVDEISANTYFDSVTEKVLNSIEAENYTIFQSYLDQRMKETYTLTEFTKLHNLLHEKVGHYGSKTFVKAESSGNYDVVYYSALYSKDANVTVKIIFSSPITGSKLVSGLWFNSPKLIS